VVHWTHRARTDLRAIHDHITHHAPLNAKSVVREIVERAGALAAAPRMGRVVPELRDPALREIVVHSWRVIYRVVENDAWIIVLVHQRRQLESGLIDQ
jgi:toxin ParE1/3/4